MSIKLFWIFLFFALSVDSASALSLRIFGADRGSFATFQTRAALDENGEDRINDLDYEVISRKSLRLQDSDGKLLERFENPPDIVLGGIDRSTNEIWSINAYDIRLASDRYGSGGFSRTGENEFIVRIQNTSPEHTLILDSSYRISVNMLVILEDLSPYPLIRSAEIFGSGSAAIEISSSGRTLLSESVAAERSPSDEPERLFVTEIQEGSLNYALPPQEELLVSVRSSTQLGSSAYVPLPASGVLLLGALGLAGFASASRRGWCGLP